jgi:eukaryotic-like serine/threonine-protein kinase
VGLALCLYLFVQERDARKRAVAAEREQSSLRERAEQTAALETELLQCTQLGVKYTEAGMLMSQSKYKEAENLMNSMPVHMPAGSAIFTVLGLLHAEHGEWQAAISNYSKVVDLLPNDPLAYFEVGTLLAQVGDVDGYRKHRARILRRFAGTSDPQTAERMAKVCLLLPPPPEDLEKLNKMVDVAVAAGTDNTYWVYF